MSGLLAELWRDESAISALEYAELLALVGAAIIVAVWAMGDEVTAVFEMAQGELDF